MRGWLPFSPHITPVSPACSMPETALGGAPVLIAMHSFTPRFKGESRAMQVGMLYNKDPTLAGIMLNLLRQEPDLTVGDNAPYAITENSDYGIPVHGENRGLSHVEIEIRQDLITDPAGQLAWAQRFARLLIDADGALKALGR